MFFFGKFLGSESSILRTWPQKYLNFILKEWNNRSTLTNSTWMVVFCVSKLIVFLGNGDGFGPQHEFPDMKTLQVHAWKLTAGYPTWWFEKGDTLPFQTKNIPIMISPIQASKHQKLTVYLAIPRLVTFSPTFGDKKVMNWITCYIYGYSQPSPRRYPTPIEIRL